MRPDGKVGSRENEYLELKGMLPTLRGLPQIGGLLAKGSRGPGLQNCAQPFLTLIAGKWGFPFGLVWSQSSAPAREPSDPKACES